jgi:hypothetical protein
LEDGDRPNTRPLPNPWASQPTYVEGVEYRPASLGTGYAVPMKNVDQFWSYNLEGQQPKWYHIVLDMFCCPCFVGPPCSNVRKGDYKRMLLSFSFWITIIQVSGLFKLTKWRMRSFIVELAIGGFAPVSQNSVIGIEIYI